MKAASDIVPVVGFEQRIDQLIDIQTRRAHVGVAACLPRLAGTKYAYSSCTFLPTTETFLHPNLARPRICAMLPTLHPAKPNNRNFLSSSNPRFPPLTPAREEVSQQLYSTLSKATTEITKGDRTASHRLQDIYILLVSTSDPCLTKPVDARTPRHQVSQTRKPRDGTTSSRSVGKPFLFLVAFLKVKAAMSVLKYHPPLYASRLLPLSGRRASP